MIRVLVIEDDTGLAFGLRNNLEIEGYEVDLTATGTEGLNLIRRRSPALIILDLMLPKLDGYQVLRRIRDDGLNTPVLILTARGEETDKVLGFRLGADDYVTKPFSVLEVLARVSALLRRSGAAPQASTASSTHRFGDVVIDEQAHVVTRAGEVVSLTPLEFDVLRVLVRRRGTVVSRQELLKEVWSHQADDIVTRTVDTHVGELRKKLENDPARPKHILTVRKIGYRLQV
jgi:two-component system, OmpR family, alkaline phosphatase synthesis response regulator PhoP